MYEELVFTEEYFKRGAKAELFLNKNELFVVSKTTNGPWKLDGLITTNFLAGLCES